MNAREILATLWKLSKPQTAAIYKRQGAGDNVFGVLRSGIVKSAKKVRADHRSRGSSGLRGTRRSGSWRSWCRTRSG